MKRLQRVSGLIQIVCFLVFSGCDASSGNTAWQADDSGSLRFTGGKEIPLPALENQTIVVNFWAVWCAPCRLEIPELNKLYAEHQVRVFGAEFDRNSGPDLSDAITEMGISFPVLLPSELEKLGLEWPEVLPVTLILRNKKVIRTLQGVQNRDSLLQAISEAESVRQS